MPETFEDALMSLIDEQMAKGVSRDEIISAMELRIMAMQEDDDE